MADHATFATAVPVFVREAGGSFELVDTETDGTLSTHDSLADARDAALEHLTLKPVVLHDAEGEPNGVWRWLIAASEESEPNPIDGVALSAENIWQFAASVNARRQAAPIDGGPEPEGMRPSDVHGLNGNSANPANGWAHAATVVVDAEGQANLHLYAELTPELAPEVIRGRIAFGSVHFTHSKPGEDGRVESVEFISYALTNRPVDQRIAPSSGRAASASALPFTSVRSVDALRSTPTRIDAEGQDMTTKKLKDEKARGAAMNVLEKAAEVLNVDLADELEGDAWASPMMDALSVIKSAAKVEQITEGTPPEERAEGDEGSEEETASRAVEGLEGAALETFTTDAIALLRKVLGKPDATPAELLSEAQANEDAFTAAANAAPDQEDGMADQQQAREAGDDKTETEEMRALRSKLAAAEKRAESEKARADKLAKDEADAKAKAETEKARAADTKWVREEVKKRSIEKDDAGIERLVSICTRSGREAVTVLLELAHKGPPSEAALTSTRSGAATSGTPRADEARLTAQRAAVDEAEKELRDELERHGKKIPSNVRAVATQRAMKSKPEAFRSRSVNPRA